MSRLVHLRLSTLQLRRTFYLGSPRRCKTGAIRIGHSAVVFEGTFHFMQNEATLGGGELVVA